MAKANFTVIAILPGRSRDYFDFCERGVTVNASGEALNSNMLALTVSVDADSKADAEARVRRMHPNYTIDSAATSRNG